MFRILIAAMTLAASSPAAPVIVSSADLAGFAGAGLAPGGGDGRLDSLAWSVQGFSDGDTRFGDTAIAGDFARGLADGPVRGGGLYGFALPSGDVGLGAQATASDFSPGSLTWQVVNDSALEWTALELGFELWIRNDGPRASVLTVDVARSGDAVSWLGVEAATRATPADAAGDAWAMEAVSTALPLERLAPGDALWLRFSLADGPGSGGRDEFALAALTLSATLIPRAPVPVAAPDGAELLAALAVPVLLLARRRARAGVPRRTVEHAFPGVTQSVQPDARPQPGAGATFGRGLAR